jgi:hypothetical protein
MIQKMKAHSLADLVNMVRGSAPDVRRRLYDPL